MKKKMIIAVGLAIMLLLNSGISTFAQNTTSTEKHSKAVLDIKLPDTDSGDGLTLESDNKNISTSKSTLIKDKETFQVKNRSAYLINDSIANVGGSLTQSN